MTILKRQSFALFAASLIVAGCSHATHLEPQARPAEARLTAAEVIRIADEAAERGDRHLSDYESPKAHYDTKDKSWWVFFNGKVPTVGNHFWVTIDDHTGTTQLHRGR